MKLIAQLEVKPVNGPCKLRRFLESYVQVCYLIQTTLILVLSFVVISNATGKTAPQKRAQEKNERWHGYIEVCSVKAQ